MNWISGIVNLCCIDTALNASLLSAHGTPEIQSMAQSKNKWLFGYEECGGFALLGEIVMLGELGSIVTIHTAGSREGARLAA
jgi:hypothetical protein